MYCRNCGEKLEKKDKFCRKCGSPKEKEIIVEEEKKLEPILSKGNIFILLLIVFLSSLILLSVCSLIV